MPRTHVDGQVVQLDNVQLGLEPLHGRRDIHRQSNRIPISAESNRTNLLELLNVLEVVSELDDRGTRELPLLALCKLYDAEGKLVYQQQAWQSTSHSPLSTFRAGGCKDCS